MNNVEIEYMKMYLNQGAMKQAPKYTCFQFSATWDEPDGKNNGIAWRSLSHNPLTAGQVTQLGNKWWDEYVTRVKSAGPRKGLSLEMLGYTLKKMNCELIEPATWCLHHQSHFTFPQKDWTAIDYRLSFLSYVEDEYDKSRLNRATLNGAFNLDWWHGPYAGADKFGNDIVLIAHNPKEYHPDIIQKEGESIEAWKQRNKGKRPS